MDTFIQSPWDILENTTLNWRWAHNENYKLCEKIMHNERKLADTGFRRISALLSGESTTIWKILYCKCI